MLIPIEVGVNQLVAQATLLPHEYPDEIEYLEDFSFAATITGTMELLSHGRTLVKAGVTWLKDVLNKSNICS